MSACPDPDQQVALEVLGGSRAWGLADADSDVDRRGLFVWRFEDHAGLSPPADTWAPEDRTDVYWEVGKVAALGLRGDPNALELLWSPHVLRVNAVGQAWRAGRDAFLSRKVYGGYGRYALGQLAGLARTADAWQTETWVGTWLLEDPSLREAQLVGRLADQAGVPMTEAQQRLARLARSGFDRGLIDAATPAALAQARSVFAARGTYRPKNAYNLLRILHAGIQILRTGRVPISVDDADLRARLFAIKGGHVPMHDVLAEAEALTEALEAAHADSPLPEQPDVAAVEALVVLARAQAARVYLG